METRDALIGAGDNGEVRGRRREREERDIVMLNLGERQIRGLQEWETVKRDYI